MALDLYDKLLDYFKGEFGNNFFSEDLSGMKEKSPNIVSDLKKFVKSLEDYSLAFVLYEAKWF